MRRKREAPSQTNFLDEEFKAKEMQGDQAYEDETRVTEPVVDLAICSWICRQGYQHSIRSMNCAGHKEASDA